MVSAKAKNGNGRPLEFMSPEYVRQFQEAAERLRPRTQKAARKLLVDLGIHTKDGRLTKKYR
jgi:hypothetical protein